MRAVKCTNFASQSAEYTTWTYLQSCQVENLGRTLTPDVEFTHRVAQRTYASLHKSAFALLVTYNYDAYYIEFPSGYCKKKNPEFFVVCTSINIRLSFLLVTPGTRSSRFQFSRQSISFLREISTKKWRIFTFVLRIFKTR